MKAVWGITANKVLRRTAAMLVVAGLIGTGSAGTSSATAATGLPDRELDPVVLTGLQTPRLIGADPDEVVAFRWDGFWKQVPVQVDERKLADYPVIRRIHDSGEFRTVAYADPGTWTGADGTPQLYAGGPNRGLPIPGTTGDPDLDENDEIALMAKDSGESAVGEVSPYGVDAGSRTVVRISDRLRSGPDRFIYLFRAPGGLAAGSPGDYVSYDHVFDPPLAGGYLTGYDFAGIDDTPTMPPANPEASVVSTPLYEQTFPGKWMVDGLRIKAGLATGVDILDGDKTTVGITGCGRNELTFSRGGGGLIADIDGPVRAIRSYIGANSGTFTQRDQIFYEGRVDTHSFVRVHSDIDGIWTAMDYSADAIGMTYRNSLNQAGVMIDGIDDDIRPGKLAWEQATGKQGSLTNVLRVTSDIPGLEVTSNYIDAESPPSTSSMLCSGDDHAYGAGGVLLKGSGPHNTDPAAGSARKLEATRTTYFGPPGETAATASQRSNQVDSPLTLDTGNGLDGEVPDVPTGPNPFNPQSPNRQNWVGLKVKVKPASTKIRPGRVKKVKVSVQNIGDKPGFRVKICASGKETLVKTSKCRTVRKLGPGRSVTRRFRVRLRQSAAGIRQVKVRFWAKASRSKARSAFVKLRPIGR